MSVLDLALAGAALWLFVVAVVAALALGCVFALRWYATSERARYGRDWRRWN
jgi:uncharacterized membrane protein